MVNGLTPMLLMQKSEKWLKPWLMGTHMRVLSESYPMNTNMTSLDGLLKSLHPCALDESSLSIGRVNLTLESSCRGDGEINQEPLPPAGIRHVSHVNRIGGVPRARPTTSHRKSMLTSNSPHYRHLSKSTILYAQEYICITIIYMSSSLIFLTLMET